MAAVDRVGVVGLGYVGLPLAIAFDQSGYEVVGVDIDDQRVEQLRNGESYVEDVEDDQVTEAVERGFEPTTEYEAIRRVDGVSVCVPTPLRKSGQPDVSYVVDAANRLADVISPETVIVLESTVYPGATEEILGERLSSNGWSVGEDVFVAFSPERIDPGNESYGVKDIPKVIGGVTSNCGDHAVALYETVFDETVRVDTATEAEFVKLLENTFRSVNIGLVNELALAAHELDVSMWDVIDAAATKPFGFMPFYPGPGLGGHCIPVDPQYLSWKAKQQGLETRFIDLADTINRRMPRHVVNRIASLLNEERIPVVDAAVLVLGAAYKPDVTDTRESPALDIIDDLESRGADVAYHDPHVPEVAIEDRTYESRPFSQELLERQDCVVIVTDHAAIDLEAVVQHAPKVFDTRNATAGFGQLEHVHRL